MLKSVSIILTTLVVATTFFFNSIPVSASNNNLKQNKRSKQEISNILEKTSKYDPQKPISQKLNKNSKDTNELDSDQKDLKIKFNLKNKNIKLENKDKGNTTIGIPNQDQYDSVDEIDNKLVYTGKNSKTDIILESVDGGFRQVINIKDSSAPNFYDFPVELEPGEKIVLTPEGGAVVQTSEIDPITKSPKNKLIIAKPWAKDVNGKDLKTEYQVNGNNLRQIIDLKGAVFPVTADPAWCGSTVNKAEWLDRPTEGGLTLSIEPTWCGRNFDDYSFVEVINKAPYNWQWDWKDRDRSKPTSKYKSMYNQFYCHFQIATFKSRWNIEPWRPLTTWSRLLSYNFPYVCNNPN